VTHHHRKSIQLTGLNLSLAGDLVKVQESAIQKERELNAELEQRAEAIRADLRTQTVEGWQALFRNLGIPEDEIGNYGLDVKHFRDHGIAVLYPLEGVCPGCGEEHDNSAVQALIASVSAARRPGGRSH
jgi:hypothetical protein